MVLLMIKIYARFILPCMMVFDVTTNMFIVLSMEEQHYCKPEDCYRTLSFARMERIMSVALVFLSQVVEMMAIHIYFDINLIRCGARQDQSSSRGMVEDSLEDGFLPMS